MREHAVVSVDEGRSKQQQSGWSRLLRVILVCVVMALGVSAWGGASAWAAAPEAPETTSATGIGNTTVTMRGVVNPKASATVSWYFEYNTGPACGGPGASVTPMHSPEEIEARSVEEHLAGLKPGSEYTYCLVVRNETEETTTGNEVSFTTTTVKPSIDKESVTSVTATEASLSASINAEGSATTYWVQYGPSEAYGLETSQVGIGAPVGDVSEQARLSGLTPGTTYHFRFVATNTLGTTFGADTVFTTPTATAAGSASGCPNATFHGFSPILPDCRAYELVSSASRQGDVYTPAGPEYSGNAVSLREAQFYTLAPFRASANGESLAFVGDPGPVGGNGSIGKGFGNEYLAARGPIAGSQGWQVADITPPTAENEPAAVSVNNSYEAFSDDLSVGILHSELPLGSSPALDPQGPAGCSVFYARTGDGRLHALFSSTLTPESCGQPRQGGTIFESKMLFAGSTEGAAQMLFQTPAALAAPAAATVGEGWNLYDSANGALSLVNVLPEGGPAANATFGGPSTYYGNLPDFEHVIARDGSRAFFSTVEELSPYIEPKDLFARENPSRPQSPIGAGGECSDPTAACTVQLDVPQAGASGTSGAGRFWSASADGTRVLFSDCHRLTTDSTAVAGSEGCEHLDTGERPVFTGADLYEYDFSRPVSERLTDLTVQHDPGNTLGADVQGVLGTSEDGSWVYFAAAGALAPGAEPRKCEVSIEQEEREELEGRLPAGKGCNLYVSHYNGSAWEAPRFVATLAAEDGQLQNGKDHQEPGIGDWAPGQGSRTARSSADGLHLIFESTQQLTGYDDSALTGAPGATREVFVYDASTDRLSCVSCDPTGAPPQPVTDPTGGGYLPWSSNDFIPRWMNATGSEVFFDSAQPLVAQDTNGVQDVYEWEREGTGSCSATTPARPDGGCVFLLSGGQSLDLSYFLDADKAGRNVFITHRGQLGGVGPADDRVHVYDVRVGGGFPESSLACTGTGCQGVPPAPPVFATPASLTFSGAGNFAAPSSAPIAYKKTSSVPVQPGAKKLKRALKACKKKTKKKRPACEKKARHVYGRGK